MFIEFFLVGLLSTTHCLVMCGPIVGGLVVSLPVSIRRQRTALFRYVVIYNTGRIVSYVLAGALAGTFGKILLGNFEASAGHTDILMTINALFLIAIGLYIAGWLPGVTRLERLGHGPWQTLSPFARSLLPIGSQGKAMVFGLIWGWFPCGLTYTVLLWTVTTGDTLRGALAMLAFGLGTFPGILMASFFSGRLTVLRQSPWIMRGFGLSIMLLAAVVSLSNMAHGRHDAHGMFDIQIGDVRIGSR